MLEHLTLTLFGNVQGVFLRRTVEHEANRQGIFGFVRNDPDGTVHIEVEGDPEKLKAFATWLKSGAGEGDYKITQVDTEKGSFKGFNTFEIKE